MSNHVAPFTRDFVLEKTFATLRENLAFSVTKTVQRSMDFVDDPEKHEEVVSTLIILASLQTIIEDFETKYKEQYK